jgi:hypothetical protein
MTGSPQSADVPLPVGRNVPQAQSCVRAGTSKRVSKNAFDLIAGSPTFDASRLNHIYHQSSDCRNLLFSMNKATIFKPISQVLSIAYTRESA